MDLTKEEIVSLLNLHDGAAIEAFDFELQRVWENIKDPNADPKKARKVTLEVEFKPDDEGFFVKAFIGCKSTLAAGRKMVTVCAVEKARDGRIEAREILPSQRGLFESGKGEGGKVVPLK